MLTSFTDTVAGPLAGSQLDRPGLCEGRSGKALAASGRTIKASCPPHCRSINARASVQEQGPGPVRNPALNVSWGPVPRKGQEVPSAGEGTLGSLLFSLKPDSQARGPASPSLRG